MQTSIHDLFVWISEKLKKKWLHWISDWWLIYQFYRFFNVDISPLHGHIWIHTEKSRLNFLYVAWTYFTHHFWIQSPKCRIFSLYLAFLNILCASQDLPMMIRTFISVLYHMSNRFTVRKDEWHGGIQYRKNKIFIVRGYDTMMQTV